MSTTPITSSSNVSYSILTSQAPRTNISQIKERVSLILLSRGRWIFRPSLLHELENLNLSEILSVELAPFRTDFAELLDEFSSVRFLLVPQSATIGQLINLAVKEARGDFCLVLWDDQVFPDAKAIARIIKAWKPAEAFFLVPEFFHHEGMILPTLMVPSLWRHHLKILTLSSFEACSLRTLFPFDYTGLFCRSTFLSTGGYDSQLTNPFWQKAEWGLRCCLWGESFLQSPLFKLSYQGDPPLEDQTYDSSYKGFFLKTMAVRFQGDHGELLLGKFWNYWKNSRLGWGTALKEFLSARQWVKTNRYRYKSDLKTLVELWDAAFRESL